MLGPEDLSPFSESSSTEAGVDRVEDMSTA